MKRLRLFTLFISYPFGGHYCGVYPSLKDVAGVIVEMSEDMEITEKLPSAKEIATRLATKDDFWHEFSDNTWIHVNEVSEQLVEHIYNTIKK